MTDEVASGRMGWRRFTSLLAGLSSAALWWRWAPADEVVAVSAPEPPSRPVSELEAFLASQGVGAR